MGRALAFALALCVAPTSPARAAPPEEAVPSERVIVRRAPPYSAETALGRHEGGAVFSSHDPSGVEITCIARGDGTRTCAPIRARPGRNARALLASGPIMVGVGIGVVLLSTVGIFDWCGPSYDYVYGWVGEYDCPPHEPSTGGVVTGYVISAGGLALSLAGAIQLVRYRRALRVLERLAIGIVRPPIAEATRPALGASFRFRF